MDFLQNGLLSLLPKTVSILLMTYFGVKCLDMLFGILKTWKTVDIKVEKCEMGLLDGLQKWGL